MILQECGRIGQPTVLLLGPIHLSPVLLAHYHFLLPQTDTADDRSAFDRLPELLNTRYPGKLYAVAIPAGCWQTALPLLAAHRLEARRLIVEGNLPLPGGLICRVLAESIPLLRQA